MTTSDTAVALGSGDVPVAATPRLAALAEEASVAALAGLLDEGQTTVGTRVEIDHLAPSPPGARVAATAVLAAVDGSRLRFEVRVDDEHRTVALAVVHRAVVDRNRFLEALR
ncbi:MAG: thioesterase [Actinobacteria bacterium]|nr:thioesterase [Actinomycetota bacterium]